MLVLSNYVGKIWIIGCLTAVLFISGCNKEQKNIPEVASSAKNEVMSATHVLATIADDEKPDIPSDHEANLSPEKKQVSDMIIEINSYGKGSAYIAKIGDRCCVVHNGKRGKMYDKIESFTLIVSPDGQRVAYGAQKYDHHYVVVDGVEKGPYADRGRIAFSPDSKHIAYDAQVGPKWFMCIDNTMNSGGVSYFDRPVFSSDSSRVAYVEVTDASGVYKLVVSDLKFKQNNTFTIADPVVVVNTEKTRIAAVEKIQNKWNVLSFDFTAPDKVTKDEPCDDVKQLTWSADGKALAYVASKDGTSQIVLNKKSDILPLGEYPWPFAIRPDNAAVGIFVANSKANTAYLHQAFVSKGQKNTVYKEGAHLAFSKDGKHYAFVGIKNEKFMIVVDGKECPIYDRVTTPTFSPDNRFLVYRARQDNKRFVVIADLNGKTIKELPRYERVFDTTFTKDGQSVAYGVKDGNQIAWKVEKL